MVFLNGEFVAKHNASISVMDRGFLFGDGVYEVIPAYNQKIFRLTEHLHRLQKSLDALQIPNPYNPQQWRSILTQLMGFFSHKNQSFYLQITRGADTERRHHYRGLSPTVYIESSALTPKTQTQLSAGFRAILLEDMRWGRCDIKATSLLASVLYGQQIKAHQVEEAILHKNDTITEGATSNVFMIKADTLFTHPANHNILCGITRDLVLESAKKCQIDITETHFSVAELLTADEVWISGSTREIMPITHINAQPINHAKIGKIWQRIYQHYQSLKYG